MLGLARRTPCGHRARREPCYGERRSEMRAVRRTKVLLLGLGTTMLLATPGEAAAYTPIGNSSCRLPRRLVRGCRQSGSGPCRHWAPATAWVSLSPACRAEAAWWWCSVAVCRRDIRPWVPRCCWACSGTPRHIASAGICCSRRRFGRAPTRSCPGWFEPTDRRPPRVSPTARSGKRPPSRSGRRRLDG